MELDIKGTDNIKVEDANSGQIEEALGEIIDIAEAVIEDETHDEGEIVPMDSNLVNILNTC